MNSSEFPWQSHSRGSAWLSASAQSLSGWESQRHRRGRRKDCSGFCLSLSCAVGWTEASNGCLPLLPSPWASAFENNAERLTGARLPWERPRVEAGNLREGLGGRGPTGETFPRQRLYWEVDWETLLSWKLCALELDMSDLCSSFSLWTPK